MFRGGDRGISYTYTRLLTSREIFDNELGVLLIDVHEKKSYTEPPIGY